MRVRPGTSQATIKTVEDKLNEAKERASGFTPGTTRSTGTSRGLSRDIQEQEGGSTAEYALSLAERRRQTAQGNSASAEAAPTRGSQPGKPAPQTTYPSRGSQPGKPAPGPIVDRKPVPQRDPNRATPTRGSQPGKPAPRKDPKKFAQTKARTVTRKAQNSERKTAQTSLQKRIAARLNKR